MKSAKLEKMSIAELVERFTVLCLGQCQAELRGENTKKGKLIYQSMAVADELKRRTGDQRAALLQLYNHPNPQVRLMAAKETFSIAPAAARQALQTIIDAKEHPQSAYAGMSLWFRDQGDFIPR